MSKRSQFYEAFVASFRWENFRAFRRCKTRRNELQVTFYNNRGSGSILIMLRMYFSFRDFRIRLRYVSPRIYSNINGIARKKVRSSVNYSGNVEMPASRPVIIRERNDPNLQIDFRGGKKLFHRVRSRHYPEYKQSHGISGCNKQKSRTETTITRQ